MPQISYIKEHKAFVRYASDERITANEYILHQALFQLFNERATCEVWPDGFIPLPNGRVLAHTVWGSGDSANETLRRARDKLIARGLIDYVPGEKRRKAPLYRLHYFTAPQASEADATFTQQNEGNVLVKVLGNRQGKALDIKEKDGDYPVTLNTHRDKPLPQRLRAGEPQSRPGGYRDGRGELQPCRYDEAWITSQRARGAVAQRLIDGYQGEQDSGDLWGELCQLMADGLPPEVIEDEMPGQSSARQLVARLQAVYLGSGYQEAMDRMRQRSDWAMLVKSVGGNEDTAARILRLRACGDGED